MSSTIQLNPNIQKDIKELPHNAEAEQGLLGAILLNNDIGDEDDYDNAVAQQTKPEIKKDSVPSSILARVKELPSEEELGQGE